MSTQRRDGRSAPTTETGRRSMRHGSRLALCKDRANRFEQANAALLTWSFPAANASGRVICLAAHLPAIAAPNTLQQQDTRSDVRSGQPVRSYCPGSPPVRQAAVLSPFFNAYPPIPSPAVFARVHPTLPHVPVARRGGPCRTERYDGKGNLYFKHAA